jgi:hypothetical protein
MVALAELLELLEKALSDRVGRRDHVRRFEGLVWNTEEVIGDDQDADGILRDVAYELGYYEPDPAARAEFSAYYGDEGLELVILTALRRLRP